MKFLKSECELLCAVWERHQTSRDKLDRCNKKVRGGFKVDFQRRVCLLASSVCRRPNENQLTTFLVCAFQGQQSHWFRKVGKSTSARLLFGNNLAWISRFVVHALRQFTSRDPTTIIIPRTFSAGEELIKQFSHTRIYRATKSTKCNKLEQKE